MEVPLSRQSYQWHTSCCLAGRATISFIHVLPNAWEQRGSTDQPGGCINSLQSFHCFDRPVSKWKFLFCCTGLFKSYGCGEKDTVQTSAIDSRTIAFLKAQFRQTPKSLFSLLPVCLKTSKEQTKNKKRGLSCCSSKSIQLCVIFWFMRKTWESAMEARSEGKTCNRSQLWAQHRNAWRSLDTNAILRVSRLCAFTPDAVPEPNEIQRISKPLWYL